MTCRTESEEAWDYYMRHVGEPEAYDALRKVLNLERSFKARHEPSGDRVGKMFEAGAAIYAERFGNEWVPF